MKAFAFVSRHAPSAEQVEHAKWAGIKLVHVGDRDGFSMDPAEFSGERCRICGDKTETLQAPGGVMSQCAACGCVTTLRSFSGVIVVHAAAAVRCLAAGLAVGVFENVNRAPAGQPPQFGCGKLVVFAVAEADAEWGSAFGLCTHEYRLG